MIPPRLHGFLFDRPDTLSGFRVALCTPTLSLCHRLFAHRWLEVSPDREKPVAHGRSTRYLVTMYPSSWLFVKGDTSIRVVCPSPTVLEYLRSRQFARAVYLRRRSGGSGVPDRTGRGILLGRVATHGRECRSPRRGRTTDDAPRSTGPTRRRGRTGDVRPLLALRLLLELVVDSLYWAWDRRTPTR